MSFLDYADKRQHRIGNSSNQYDFWFGAKEGYKDNYKSYCKVSTKELKSQLEELSIGRCMYAVDMGYEYGQKRAIKDILSWRDKHKK